MDENNSFIVREGDVGEGDVGSQTTYDMGLLGADSASCFRTYVPYYDGEL